MAIDSAPNSKELLVTALRQLKAMRTQLAAARQAHREPIAIVGMACRFPGGADTPDAYWDMLRGGVDAVREVPADRWDIADYYDADPAAPGKIYTRLGGFVENVAGFDPVFFGIAPREAAKMDPQQRLLLEVAWEALEHAGLPVESLANSQTGVFVGLASSDYAQLLAEASGVEAIDAYVLTGNAPNVSAGRVAYVLGLQGPAMAVDTACSSSLVSVHLACQSLRDRECDAALAAGVNLILSPVNSIAFCRMNAIARDGRCKTFDAAADGFIRGEGCGVVVLRRLSDALDAGDTIYALIRGSAVNQDGHTSALTVPNGPAQQAVIRAALERAGVGPHDVGYVEAHGTGTPLGDPIELQALAEAYDRAGPSAVSPPLYVGSVKTNFGHLEGAAGIAGLIKAVLALRHRAIPPHLHFHEPNPRLDWQRLALRVPTTLTAWPAGEGPRRAAVSAFGFSGTNAHVVLEEAPAEGELALAAGDALITSTPRLLLLSARSEEQLRAVARRTTEFLDQAEDSLDAICYASQARRSHWNWRLAIAVETVDALRQKLRVYLDSGQAKGLYAGSSRPQGRGRVAFLFSGQGGQQIGMGRALYRSQPAFQEAFDRCARAAGPYLDRPLAELCFDEAQRGRPFDHLASSQVALFALQVALASLWRSWGVEPAVVLGHSLGEYAAAVAAGTLDLEAAAILVAERARLMANQGVRGSVGVVLADLDAVQPFLEKYADKVWLAGRGDPRALTFAGYGDAMSAFLQDVEAAGIKTRSLPGFDRVAFPIHTPLMEPVVAGLASLLDRSQLRPPSIDFISSYTGRLVDAELTSTAYWIAQSRRPFDMEQAVQTLIAQRVSFAVELGPGSATAALARRLAPRAPITWLPSLQEGRGDAERIIASLAQLHVGGVAINWQALHGERRYPPVALPLTPFLRERYWLDESGTKAAAASRTPAGAGSANWLGERVPSPLDAVIFSAVVEPGSFAFLPDHLVHDRVVVAGSAHLARALAAAQETTGGGPWRMEEIVFAQPLVLQAGQPRLAQLIWQPEGSGRAAVLIASAGAGDARPAWMRHLTGYAVRADQSAAAESNTDLARLRGECSRFADPDTFYAELAERGYYFGPAFRWIEAVQHGEGQALCRLRAPTPVDVADGTPLPPGLLDACLQSLSATIATAGLPVYVPYSVDRITFYGAPAGPTWCHAVARDTLNGQGMVAGDVRLYDEAGRLVLEVAGLHGRPISAEELRRAVTAAAPASGLFFQVQWAEAAAATPAAGPAGGVWLLLADEAGVAAALAKRLAANARTVVCVRPGDAFRRVGQGEWEMRPAEAGDYRRLLAGVAESYGAAASEVVHLWSLEPGHADPLEAQRLGGESLILLIQAIAARAGPLPRVRAITAGAAPGYANSRSGTAWAAAALWGLGPVIAAEYPELWAGLVDIDPQDADVIAALWDALSTPAGEQRLVLRGRLRYAARLTAGTASSGARPAPPDIVPDATYLISGGLGALGMVVARWLVARGARHLVLLSRSAPDEPAAVAIAALAETGVQVAARAVDIAWPEQVEQLLAKVRTTMPPLRGVFHLAGVLEDATLAQVTVGQYRRVVAPKLAGAWNLHRLTLDDRLDYFVLFSSAAALLGPPGQAAYAGANAALDALAHVRRDSGLPALSINWGPWQGGGMTGGSSNHPRRWGLEPLAPDQALRALDQALALDLAQVAVIAWQPAALQPQALNVGGPSFLAELLPSPPAGEAGRAAALRTRLAQAPAARRRGLLLEELQREAVRVLGLPRSAVLDTQQPLNEYGLDSLMAVELRNAVVRLAGQAVPVTFLFDYPTLEAAANYLLATVFHLETEAPPPDETARPAGLERQIAGLSEAEAEARLAEALAALRAGDPQ